MNRKFAEQSLQYMRFQRNIFAALALFLAIAMIPLCGFLFLKRERIIIAPPVIEKSFWVDRSKVSPTYLEQYGYFLGQLLLGKSAHSAPAQRSLLLRHTSAQFVGALKQKLLEEEEMLKKQNASYTFFPTAVHVNPTTNEVKLEGDRVFYVSGKQVSSDKESYILKFVFSGSRLLLTEVTASAKGNHHA